MNINIYAKVSHSAFEGIFHCTHVDDDQISGQYLELFTESLPETFSVSHDAFLSEQWSLITSSEFSTLKQQHDDALAYHHSLHP